MTKILYENFERLSKDLFSVCIIFLCIFFNLPAFTISDEMNNITVFEASTNYSMYNDSNENITLFSQNISDFDINETSDVSTELDSTISVTEDSDSSFQSETNKKLFLFLTADEDICNCDLTSNVCDINCCCDPDCDEEDMQVFSECSYQALNLDENYCYQKDIILRNNTVYKMVKDSRSNMFCIVHDNFKHRLRFKDMPILKSHRDLTSVLKYKYKTTYSWDIDSENAFDSSELRAGSPIYIDKSNKKITTQWSLPSSCLSDMCSCNEDVRYLHDFQSSCSYAVGDLRKRCEMDEVLSGNRFLDFCISSSGRAFGSSSSLAELVVHTRTVGSNTTGDDEIEVNQATSKRRMCVGKNPRKPRWSSNVCNNVTSHVHFTVEQDGAGGITGIAVDFRYIDVSFEKESLTQSYSVNFVWSSNSSSENPVGARKKSGNPGYQVGLPILAATNGSEDGMISGTLHDEIGGLSVLEREPDGSCSLSGNHRRTIKFGMNLKTGCFLKRKLKDCKILRSTVSDVLLGPPGGRQVFVGAFGNANSSDPDDWIEVFREDEEDTNPGEGNSCYASLGLKVDVVYAAVGTVANPQHKIVGVGFHRTKSEFVDMACSPQQQNCREVILSTSVSFFDVTLPAVEHYAKVPSIKANLPSDFFYPFLYSTALGNNVKAGFVPILMWGFYYFVILCHNV